MSDRIAPAVFTVRVAASQAKHLCLKLIGRQGAKDITHGRVKAIAAVPLDAVGQPQTHSTPSGAATQTHKQKGSLGE